MRMGVAWKKVVLGFIVFLFFLPLLLPDDYSGIRGEERDVAKVAIDAAETELVLIWRYKVRSIEDAGMGDESWRVGLIGYTYFHIPVEEAEITQEPRELYGWAYWFYTSSRFSSYTI